jgi:hypothetical protein
LTGGGHGHRLLIVHGLVAVALLGAITHQALATWAPSRARPDSFFGRFRGVPSASYANAIVVLYAVSTLLGGIVYLDFRIRHQARSGARRRVAGARSLRPQGAFRIHWVGASAGLLGVLAATARRRIRTHARRADLDSRLRRLVELSHWSRREQHQGLRRMTSSRFRSFAFAYGTAFAVLYVIALKLDLALFTVYPSLGVVLLGTHHSRDITAPSMAYLAPAMYWYGWAATAALGALVFGLVAALLPERWTQRFWLGWLWVTPALAMIACVYLTLPWFRL